MYLRPSLEEVLPEKVPAPYVGNFHVPRLPA
jgi:hypothetical protein